VEVRTLKKLIPVLGLLLIVAIGTVSAETFHITMTVSGYGSGTVADTATHGDDAFLGTGFTGKDMSFSYIYSTRLVTDTATFSACKSVDVDASKLTAFESQIHIDDKVDTVFGVYNAKGITVNYRAGMTADTDGVYAYRNIDVDAYKIKTGDEDFNLLSSESALGGNLQHTFAANANMKNIELTIRSSATKDYLDGGLVTYNLHYNPSKFNGEMTNSYKYYEYTGGTSISGTYNDLVFNFNVRVPLVVD